MASEDCFIPGKNTNSINDFYKLNYFIYLQKIRVMKLFFYGFCFLIISSCKTKQNEVSATGDEVQASTQVSTALPAEAENGLNWLDIQAAANDKNEAGKMYFVDVYTEWCGWCKVMDKKTFSDPTVQKALNDRFHVVKFDAEHKESIVFNNMKYDWQNAGRNGINGLAIEFLGGEMSFPSYVYLDKNKKPFKVSKGFMPAEQFLAELSTVK
jgi:thioredoxin-related protein